MKSLEEQFNDPEENAKEILFSVLDVLGIYQGGGGPEGIYYTAQEYDAEGALLWESNEYLFRNLPALVKEVINHNKQTTNT